MIAYVERQPGAPSADELDRSLAAAIRLRVARVAPATTPLVDVTVLER